jgi:osmotically-inducible protein OsmY
VLLTGEVPSEQDKQSAEQIATKVENVRSVINDLGVMGASSLTQRSSDALTTGKVKASLVDDKLLQAGAFKVVTERGTTYLMGLVTTREADRATNLARTVSGVQRVVRAFELISDQDLNRTGTTPLQTDTTPRQAP